MRITSSRGAVRLLAVLTFTLALGSLEFFPHAHAQSVPKSLEEGGSDAAMRARKNNWTVGVAGGQLSGTYMTFANEMAEVLDDGENLRVVPIVTYGAASNLDDLLYLRQVDVAVTQADVFDYFRTQRKISNPSTGSIISFGCRFRKYMSSRAPTFIASKTCAVRKSALDRPGALRA